MKNINNKKITIDFNEEQKNVLNCFQNMAVIAGAGTGKTKTLIEYIVRFLEANPEENHLNNVLAVTFTNKAAEEMRKRLFVSLHDKILETKDDTKMRSFW
ncbi:MAG: UvrD-helicase domain-containing protein, partial [Deltaproteobacteria bacterium]|nr:UvrD-helicase domain-containing protein [Deltaproteobacteria bacterium]